MRKFLVVTALLVSNIGLAQQTQQSLQITRIYGITSSWPGECGPGVIDNRSTLARRSNYHSFYATGSGTWSVVMSWSDVACTGPWTQFGSTAVVTQSNGIPIGSAFGYHPFIQMSVTGNASVTYSGEKDFFINPSSGGGGGGGGGSCPALGTGSTVPFSANPTFNMASGYIQTMVLAGTVTTPVFTNIVPFCTYQFYLCQDNTGNHTFTWPGGAAANMQVGLNAGKCSAQNFFAPDASHLVATAPGLININVP